MKVKSYEDLDKLVKKYKRDVVLRETGIQVDNNVEVLVGLGETGIKAKADEVLKYLGEYVFKHDITNVRVVRSQFKDHCDKAPLVMVNMPNKESVLYGNVDKKVAKAIIEDHILNNKIVESNVVTA